MKSKERKLEKIFQAFLKKAPDPFKKNLNYFFADVAKLLPENDPSFTKAFCADVCVAMYDLFPHSEPADLNEISIAFGEKLKALKEGKKVVLQRISELEEIASFLHLSKPKLDIGTKNKIAKWLASIESEIPELKRRLHRANSDRNPLRTLGICRLYLLFSSIKTNKSQAITILSPALLEKPALLKFGKACVSARPIKLVLNALTAVNNPLHETSIRRIVKINSRHLIKIGETPRSIKLLERRGQFSMEKYLRRVR